MAPDQLTSIKDQIGNLIKIVHDQEQDNTELLAEVCFPYLGSAKNLLHYGTVRNYDLREIQTKLKELGLSRLANAEGNILESLINTHNLLKFLTNENGEFVQNGELEIGKGKRKLEEHAEALFSNGGKNRRVRIMVTMPTEASTDYEMVLEMVKNGMDCARINCAHDSPEVWKKIVENLRKASEACNANVKIAMDLAGPKIRTGALGEGPKVKKFRPKRNDEGVVESPAAIVLVPEDKQSRGPDEIPVPSQWIELVQLGDKFVVQDARGKTRKLVVTQVAENTVLLQCRKTIYLKTGMQLVSKRVSLPNAVLGEISPKEKAIEVHVGDTLIVKGHDSIGSLPKFDEKGNLVNPGSIACQPPSLVEKVKEGAPILFDDGKVEGVIERVHDDSFEVRIVKARQGGTQLKAEKGINFPTLDLGFSGLTAKDKEDLKFIARYVDIVSFSFVNTESDVEELLEALNDLEVLDKIGVILKIETRFAYKNLMKILLKAMKTKPIGVMIARGDLALEVGWENMGKVQEEILSICSAAHVPVVWATQVLEGLAKKGLPSRSEITDVTSSLRAECVMLNKGLYINEAISLLDKTLESMEELHSKKEGLWPKMDNL
ncbi:pyruvate kinase [Flagellimonas meridianipacifica]|uniref:pyruvate kinase n=1 Tax=Flagellimonas meridianipacifica TaxID=1080225 RepID=A0A2T0MFR2_9FLAO|nr:pyruvate kinase [Allomuricauda pacifica]PRX56404.1 pyruvate kinase [Allomuricauda pacifica]